MPWPRSPQQKDTLLARRACAPADHSAGTSFMTFIYDNALQARTVSSVSGSHRTCGAGVGLRAGAPTAGGGGGEVLLTRMSGLTASGLVACSLVMSRASLSTLWRTAARLRDMAAS